VKRIVIATDGSEGSRRAVEAGVALACPSGAVATFAYVRNGVPLLLGDPFYSRRLSADLAKARATVDEAMSRAAEAGVASESEILEGDAAEEILGLARLRDADLIVVGSRDLGRVAGAMLGSVSNAVVHNADRPVLVVKPRTARARASG